MLKKMIQMIFGVAFGLLGWLLLVRLVRYFYKFQIPHFMTPIIDSPLRHRVQDPDELAERHGLRPGMSVLEVGPGYGNYTLAAARRVGPAGKIFAIDIQPEVIAGLRRRIRSENVENVEGRIEDVYHLPFEDDSLDAAFMITVIGEIPEPVRAMSEIYRVLKPGGTLAFSELLLDPDYPLPNTTLQRAVPVGFFLKEKTIDWMSYTLLFEKPAAIV